MTILGRKNKNGSGCFEFVRIRNVQRAIIFVGVRIDDYFQDFAILPEVRLGSEFIFSQVGRYSGAVNHVLLEDSEI